MNRTLTLVFGYLALFWLTFQLLTLFHPARFPQPGLCLWLLPLLIAADLVLRALVREIRVGSAAAGLLLTLVGTVQLWGFLIADSDYDACCPPIYPLQDALVQTCWATALTMRLLFLRRPASSSALLGYHRTAPAGVAAVALVWVLRLVVVGLAWAVFLWPL